MVDGIEERARELWGNLYFDKRPQRVVLAEALKHERDLALREAEKACAKQENSWHADEDQHKASELPGWDEGCDYMAKRCAVAIAALREAKS